MWRVDYLLTPHADVQTTWHESKVAADVAEWRLRFRGVQRVVSWFDAAAYEGLA